MAKSIHEFARRLREYRGLEFALAVAILAAPAAAGAQTLEGARLFQRCYACHSLDPAERALPGPSLRGLFGRRAGTLEGFDYSPALREAGARGLVWTEETLDRFLEDPEEFVPGARMGGVWLREPAERRGLIRWLTEAAR
jgi:cytochrome c